MRIAIITTLALLALVTPAAAADGWFTLNDPDGVFRIDMPQEPVTVTTMHPGANGGQWKETRYMIQGDGRLMMTMVADHDGPAITSDEALDRAVTGLQQHGRTLKSQASVTVDGHVGRDVILITDTGSTLKDRLFFVGNRLYQVLAGLPANPPQDQVDAADRYAHSLHFLK